jgi:chromosome segregation ATPase
MVLADLRQVREGELSRAAIVHNDLAVAQQRIDEIAAQVDARGEALALRETQLEASRTEIEELRTKAGGLENHVAALQAHVANLEAARADMGSQLQSLQNHAASCRSGSASRKPSCTHAEFAQLEADRAVARHAPRAADAGRRRPWPMPRVECCAAPTMRCRCRGRRG